MSLASPLRKMRACGFQCHAAVAMRSTYANVTTGIGEQGTESRATEWLHKTRTACICGVEVVEVVEVFYTLYIWRSNNIQYMYT